VQETYAFGPFRIDTRNKLLFRGSEPVRLGRRPIALLLALVERPGAVVSKDALIEAAWPNQTVEESNLAVQIVALRRVLGETAGGDRWIETMPRRGYRFVGPMNTEAEKSVWGSPPQVDSAPDLAATQQSQPELFAQHYAEAGLTEQSVACWGKAGRRSADRSAMAEAAAQYQKGLDQLALLPDSPERQRQELELYSSLAVVLRLVKGYASLETGRALDCARVLWEQLSSPSEFLNIPFWQSLHHHTRGELDLAGRLDDGLLLLSHRRNDSAGLVLGHLSFGRTLMLTDGFALSRSHLEAALALYDPISHRSLTNQIGMHPHVNLLAFLGIVLSCLGYPEQGLAQSNAAIAEARRLGHPPSLAVGLTNGCVVLSLVGDSPAVGKWADELAAVAAEQSFPSYRSHATLY
jgi:DNA-binding winged helix-turn-helix (wHTH) protein